MAIRRAFAQEDTNLNTVSITSTRVRQYSDIDLTFTAKPSSGEIYKKFGSSAVKQSIKTLILTNAYEKPFNPNFGGNLIAQLFELADRNGSSMVRRDIIENIEVYEPRAEIIKVDVSLQPDNNLLDLTIKFKVVNTEEQVEFTTTLARLR
jgi:phage baseplate assembly protein W